MVQVFKAITRVIPTFPRELTFLSTQKSQHPRDIECMLDKQDLPRGRDPFIPASKGRGLQAKLVHRLTRPLRPHCEGKPEIQGHAKSRHSDESARGPANTGHAPWLLAPSQPISPPSQLRLLVPVPPPPPCFSLFPSFCIYPQPFTFLTGHNIKQRQRKVCKLASSVSSGLFLRFRIR